MEDSDFVGEGSSGIEDRQACERASLVGVDEAQGSGQEGEAGFNNPFQDFRHNREKGIFFCFFVYIMYSFVLGEPEGRTARYKELACSDKLWRKQNLCGIPLLPA